MKQTAVEFLIKAFQGAYGDKVINVVSVQVEQAKEMEKEQIIEAYTIGSYDMAEKEFRPEQYYQETYGTQTP